MTTENGLVLTQHARRNIEVLRERKDFLLDKVEYLLAQGKENVTQFSLAEARALDWAITVLEVEFDNLARMQRNVRRLENRSHDSPAIPKGAWLLAGEEPVPAE